MSISSARDWRGRNRVQSNSGELLFQNFTRCLTLRARHIQYSLVDSRPTMKMEAVCLKYGVKLLAYGSFVSIIPCLLCVLLSKSELPVRRFLVREVVECCCSKHLLRGSTADSFSTKGRSTLRCCRTIE